MTMTMTMTVTTTMEMEVKNSYDDHDEECMDSRRTRMRMFVELQVRSRTLEAFGRRQRLSIAARRIGCSCKIGQAACRLRAGLSPPPSHSTIRVSGKQGCGSKHEYNTAVEVYAPVETCAFSSTIAEEFGGQTIGGAQLQRFVRVLQVRPRQR